MKEKAALKGVLAFTILLSVYFVILTLVSGWNYALVQFNQYWYYIVSLALGFGIQISLYSYLRNYTRQTSGKQLVATGTTSTAAMISCCAHYLTNILPILGASGIIAFITAYQVQFFWIGLTFNLLGILYIGSKVIKATGLKIGLGNYLYIGLLAIVLLVFLINSVSINISPKNTNATQVESRALETKEDTQGAVTVAVTPQNANTFEISLNTHSVELSNDLTADTQLLDDKGNSYKPVSWDGAPAGGHHRSGILKFSALTSKPKSIELKIKDIGGIPERSFKWDL